MHAVCDVIVARTCGILPPFAAILLVLDCVVKLWISLCVKAAMYISLRLEYRESCVVTQQLSLMFCKAINKAVCNSPLKVEPVVLILASRPKVITSFFWPSHRVPRLSPAQCALHLLEVKYAIKPIVWVATQRRVAISPRVRKKVAPKRS